MNISEKISKKDVKLPNVGGQNELHVDFWDENGKMLPKVREGLLKIAYKFLESLDMDIDVTDIVMTGSLANYNYTPNSDVDLHIITDYNKFSKDKDFVMQNFLNIKNIWADKYDVTIHDFPVEIFIQDEESKKGNDWSATYSVLKNEWLNKPEKQKKTIDRELVKQHIVDITNKIDEIVETYSTDLTNEQIKLLIDRIASLKKEIREGRQKSLEEKGEFGEYNLAFKYIRNNNVLDKVDEIKYKLLSKYLSIDEYFLKEQW